ncbi:hypothetical protein JAAARDRAFT_198191 [Jaapia argillacea MUCL 33604]|uniref:Small ribosomal subunit protein uS10m n=1 Tax=Jaapia argillacea MUCL 33604 TaxID=933084 RepID=A0A067PQF6_9AGAM|nr:hypothetical protein JAAARDRAFT_198191 [Jaapia argillacea MUCL 33604]
MLPRPSILRPSRLLQANFTKWSRMQTTFTPPKIQLDTKQLMEETGMTEPELSATVIHGRSITEPLYHPRTHNIPVAVLQFRSYFPELLDLYMHFAAHAAGALGIPISKPVKLPTQRSLWTVIKSPFIFKKSQENFERRTRKRAIKAWDADEEVVDKWVKYLERHALAGVGLRVVKWERAPVGVGEKKLKSVMGQLRLSGSGMTNAQKVKALGEKIVQEELAAAAVESPAELKVVPPSPSS